MRMIYRQIFPMGPRPPIYQTRPGILLDVVRLIVVALNILFFYKQHRGSNLVWTFSKIYEELGIRAETFRIKLRLREEF